MAPTTEVTITVPTFEGVAAILAAAYYATGEAFRPVLRIPVLTKIYSGRASLHCGLRAHVMVIPP